MAINPPTSSDSLAQIAQLVQSAQSLTSTDKIAAAAKLAEVKSVLAANAAALDQDTLSRVNNEVTLLNGDLTQGLSLDGKTQDQHMQDFVAQVQALGITLSTNNSASDAAAAPAITTPSTDSTLTSQYELDVDDAPDASDLPVADNAPAAAGLPFKWRTPTPPSHIPAPASTPSTGSSTSAASAPSTDAVTPSTSAQDWAGAHVSFSKTSIDKAASANPPDYATLAANLGELGSKVGKNFADKNSKGLLDDLKRALSANPVDPQNVATRFARFSSQALKLGANADLLKAYNGLMDGVLKSIGQTGNKSVDQRGAGKVASDYVPVLQSPTSGTSDWPDAKLSFTQTDITAAANANPPDYAALANHIDELSKKLGKSFSSKKSQALLDDLKKALLANPVVPQDIATAFAKFSSNAIKSNTDANLSKAYNALMDGVLQSIGQKGNTSIDQRGSAYVGDSYVPVLQTPITKNSAIADNLQAGLDSLSRALDTGTTGDVKNGLVALQDQIDKLYPKGTPAAVTSQINYVDSIVAGWTPGAGIVGAAVDDALSGLKNTIMDDLGQPTPGAAPGAGKAPDWRNANVSFSQKDITDAATANPPDTAKLGSYLDALSANLNTSLVSKTSMGHLNDLTKLLQTTSPDRQKVANAFAKFSSDGIKASADPDMRKAYDAVLNGILQAIDETGNKSIDKRGAASYVGNQYTAKI